MRPSLLEDLKKLEQWPSRVRAMQENWIGKSYGVEIFFKVKDSDRRRSVFLQPGRIRFLAPPMWCWPLSIL